MLIAVNRMHRCATQAPSLSNRLPGRDARLPGACGFSLIELMVVVAIIAVLVAILVIPALGARMRGNETSAIAALRTISTQQENFRGTAAIDQDGNGIGEFGLLGELTGHVVPRRSSASKPISPRMIDSSFQPDATGFAIRYGFYFLVYLPVDDVGGTGTDADLGGDATTPGPILGDAAGIACQQYYWCAYAWPSGRNTGERAFFIDHSGVLYQTHGDAVKYAGTTSVPEANAAYGAEVYTSHVAGAAGNTGNDGNVWTVVQ